VIGVYLTNIVEYGSCFRAGGGRYIIIKATGHAGFGKKNTDIVCAGISAIIQTAIAAITKVAGIKQKVKQKDGFIESTIKIGKLEPADLNNLFVIINTMLTGLDEINRVYPEALKINFDNR
jgi:uncharacterized protein